jgi:hypothetical protein
LLSYVYPDGSDKTVKNCFKSRSSAYVLTIKL